MISNRSFLRFKVSFLSLFAFLKALTFVKQMITIYPLLLRFKGQGPGYFVKQSKLMKRSNLRLEVLKGLICQVDYFLIYSSLLSLRFFHLLSIVGVRIFNQKETESVTRSIPGMNERVGNFPWRA